ncbi:MAG: hypothetical protein KF862_16520 [Chitinophagaceae bacterium]|nr:hypothetical protein [Chitinophagaceae bacterium]
MERTNNTLCIFYMFLLITLSIYRPLYASIDQKKPVEVNNGFLKIAFDNGTGELLEMTSLKNEDAVIIDGKSAQRSPWEIVIGNGDQAVVLNARSAKSFSSKQNGRQLELKWSRFNKLPPKFAVAVSVELLPDSAMSVWNIRLDEMQGLLISKVTFPKISGIADLGNEELAVPDWMGSLLSSPRTELRGMQPGAKRFGWNYPGHMSLQLVTLYNPDRFGLYFSCDDTLAYNKVFSVSMDDNDQLQYGVDNFPIYDNKENTYRPPYNYLIGVYRGDWITAAKQYRAWGSRQSWSRNSRLKNGKVPEWLQNTGYWEWNRGRASNVLTPAVSLKKRLNVPVSVLWHWWHGASYDDSFPEFFPPRDGKPGFKNALRSAQQQGIKALVYMNTLSWGTSTQSWKSLNAENYAAIDINGNMNSHMYNIFTKKSMVHMCDGTDFWRRKYAALADTAINEYGVDGIYMDQACLSMRCYNPAHGHTIGGGNYWVEGADKKDRLIRQQMPAGGQQVLAGEGGAENWLPFLDGFLTLQVSKERYAGVRSWQTIPLFQAVYHEYGISFGNYSSLLSPPYDEKWPKEFVPADAETPLSPEFNDQFLMEQARSFAWGIQPMISNYQPFLDTIRATEIDYISRLAKVRRFGLQYFVHGEFMRAPSLAVPEENIVISRLSIYAGRDQKVTRFEKTFPEVYVAAWKSPDKSLAIAIASISKKEYPVQFAVNTAEYGIGGSGEVYFYDEMGRKKIGDYSDLHASVNFSLPARGICFVELIPSR